MNFDKDTETCKNCPDYEVCALYTGNECLQDMKRQQSLKQKQSL